MNWDSPSIEDSLGEFEAAGKTHVIVVPSAFPTAAIHTMWDVAQAAMGRAVQPAEGVVVHTQSSVGAGSPRAIVRTTSFVAVSITVIESSSRLATYSAAPAASRARACGLAPTGIRAVT